ncbi:hypothetical protein HXY33_04570 [Candidatus Bathyarchaeota archaeon]|nr:hypothetical protein [Candidatus Bathyarchaeota archaeon]
MSIEKLKLESNQELQQMITDNMSMVEKDLTLICNNVPINDRTTLDVLCHDGNGQLVIAQLSVNEDDLMLLYGIQSLDYVNKFKSFLKATYNKHKIDDKENPRLILIAPSFSDALRLAVESIKGIRIDLYEWEYLKLGDHKGLRLQPIFGWKQSEKLQMYEEKQAEKKREPKQKKKEQEPEPMPEPEPLTTEPEPQEEVLAFPPPSSEEPKEEEKTYTPKKEEPPKRKLKLF